MAPRVVCALLITFQVVCAGEPYRNDGLMDRLSSGMKFAQNFLGSESVALKVAEFVVRAFQTANKPPTSNRRWPQNDLHSEESSASSESESYTQDKGPDYDVNEAQSPLTPLRQIVRLFGLQPNQISAVAVNALVFVAQMISTFLSGPRRPTKPYRSEDPTTWILNKNSRSLQDLIAAAKNESLPDTIITDTIIQDQGTEEETSCIRLLVCKVTPFISKMQKTVFGNEEGLKDEKFAKELRGSAVMYRHLPTAEEINARNDICEQQHKDCNLNE